MRRTINIDFDNSSSILLGSNPALLSTGASGYALSTHTHGVFAGTNITLIGSASSGLSLSVGDPSAASNSVYVTGPNLTLSSLGISTTIGVTGLQPAGAYLTTAALSNHVHGGAPSITGNIGGTIGVGGWSLSEPGFLLTAAASDHTHSDKAGTGTTVGATNNTLFKMTLNSNGLNVSVPAYLTTAASVSHTHGTFAGTNITRVYSSTDGLRLSVNNAIGQNTSSNTVSGSTFYMSGNSSGLTVSMPKFITTQEFTAYGSNYVFSGFSSSSSDTRGIPYGLSLTAQPGNLLSLSDGGAGSLTSSGASGYILISSGTAMLVGSDNITLIQDGNRIAFVGAASGTDAGIAFSMSTSNTSGAASLVSSGTIYFQGGDNITLSQNSVTVNIVGAPAGIVGVSNSETMYTSGSVILSDYANITISSSVDGTKQYFRFSVADPAAATNAINAGDYLSSAVLGGLTSLSVTGLVANTAPHLRQIAASDSSYTSGSVQISGSNNITVSYNASTILISGPVTHGIQTGISGIAGSGASTVDAGTVQFGNLNGISFGLNGSTMTASYASTHVHGTPVTTATNGSVITFNSASSGLTLAVPPYLTAAGAHTHNSIAYSSSTTGTDIKLSSASDSFLLGVPLFAVTSHTHSNLYAVVTHTHNSNVLSFSNFLSSTTGSSSNSLVLGLTAYPATSFVNISDTGNVYFINSNGMSFGSTYSSLSTTVTGSIDSGNIYFVNPFASGGTTSGSNMTWGSSANGISTSIFMSAGGGFNAGVSNLSNDSGTTGTVVNQVVFAGGANITLSQSSNAGSATITVIGGAGGGGIASLTLGGNVAPGATSYASGSQIQLVGGQNITLSGYNTTNLRIDGAPSGTLSLINTNGVSFISASAGSTTSISASIADYIPLTNSTSFGQVWSLSSSTGGSVVAGTTSSSYGSILRLVAGSNITLSGNTYGVQIIGAPAGVIGLGNTATIPFTSGSVMVSGANLTINISQGAGASTASQYIQVSAPAMGYLYFSNIAGFSWSSTTNGVSTSVYLVTA